MKKIIVRILAVALVLGAAWGGYQLFQKLPQRKQQIPTATVRQGEVVIRAFSRGELRAVRSVTLTAPNLRGTVQVTRLAPLGAFARERDLIVEFDDAEVLARIEENQLELEQIDEQIKKAEAELAIRNNQDQVELLRARYSVRRAELEVQRNELLSAIDARKNLLNLEEARRRLQQLESDIQSRLQQAEAELAVLKQQRNRITIEQGRERERLNQVRLLSPISGLVSIHQNRFTGGRMFGMQVPDIREGDQVQPGMPVADVLDLSEMEVVAKIGEIDRANLLEGQQVNIQLDALPESVLHGTIKSMSGTASRNVFSGDPSRKFDVLFSIDMRELLSVVGATPQQIARVLETAERNRARPNVQVSTPAFDMAGMSPAAFGGMPQAALSFEQGAGASATSQEGGGGVRREGVVRRGEGGMRGGAPGGVQMSPEDRQKLQEALKKELGDRSIQDLSPEERQQIFRRLRGQSGPSGEGQAASPSEGPAMAPIPSPGPAAAVRQAGVQFTQKDLETARLPAAPEADSQLEVLLRPGLLADVEIIVEQIPDAIHIPVQAVFDKEGRLVVYVKVGERFEERPIRIMKQSESIVVVAEGLRAGEQVALDDPFAVRGPRREEAPAGGGSPMGAGAPGGRT